MEIRRQELLRQMREVEQRTVQSSKNCLGLLSDTEKVGIETAEELVKQREQLVNTDCKLDNINATLKDTQTDINGIKSVFSSLRNWWSAPKKEETEEEKKKKKSPSTPAPAPAPPSANPNLGSAYQSSHSSVLATQKASPHPTLTLKGLDDDSDDLSLQTDFKARSKAINQRLDNDLDDMSAGLSRIRGLAVGLGTEIEDQNQMIDRIHSKAERADFNISSQNSQMKKIIKR
ncbi:hypothetical protein Pmani_034871 [Petrolisthes manimaculis]|uniref:t-SNARE coiled-coil homology domain-containing protein n=1 Tax=Petrolisthes manimaculis TaxID=1843537 RepID=A0AAE1TR50_9EUCA|nr:hypothetical protein Pmani_034871 [Petrolisthes manimaculis]